MRPESRNETLPSALTAARFTVGAMAGCNTRQSMCRLSVRWITSAHTSMLTRCSLCGAARANASRSLRKHAAGASAAQANAQEGPH
eukprot:3884636-Pleurochrysis_carterae.AAC.3